MSSFFSSSIPPTPLTITSTITLSNGVLMPRFGLGTWRSPKGAVETAVIDAVKAGYRHIDCAWIYKNQNEVGSAIEKLINDGIIKREEIFITSKLWVTHLNPNRSENQLKEILSDLKLKYLDLLLIHWPVPLQYIEGSHPDAIFGKDDKGVRHHDNIPLIEIWKKLESFVDQGYVKSIGVSNFNENEIKEIINNGARIKPVVNQVECHIYLQQKSLKSYCESQQIYLTAYSPLGNLNPSDEKKLSESPLSDTFINTLSKKYNKTPAQLLIRWQLQVGNIVIPKSTTTSRIIENSALFDFSIDNDDMKLIDKLDKGFRFINPPFRPGDNKMFPEQSKL